MNDPRSSSRQAFLFALLGGGVSALALTLWTSFAPASMGGRDQKAVEQTVRQYLLANPEVIPEAMEELERRKSLAQIGDNRAALEKPFKQGFIGKANAPITIVEFSDYACGYCSSSVEAVAQLVQENPDVKLVVREVPILSEQSQKAALWALAAAEQGKYDAFHNGLFAIGKPTDENILAAATQAGLNVELARKQIDAGAYSAELDNNLELMRALGSGGTPTFVIGEQIFPGAVGYDVLAEAVGKARKAKAKG